MTAETRKGILVIWEAFRQERPAYAATITTQFQQAISKHNLDRSWVIIEPLPSLRISKENGTSGIIEINDYLASWGVNEIGLLLLHLENDGGAGYDFYINQCNGIPAVLFSSSPEVKTEYLKKTLGEASFSHLQPQMLFMADFGEKIKNVSYWFSYWQDTYRLDPASLAKTKEALIYGDTRGHDFLEMKASQILQRFLALDILLQGYLAIRDWKNEQVDGLSWPEFCEKHGILKEPEDRERALQQTSLRRLLRPPKSNDPDGYYWFDECAEDIQGPSPFSAENDEILTGICDLVKTSGKFSEPDLSALTSTSAGKLRVLWNLLQCHYANTVESGTESFLDLSESWQWDPKTQKWFESSVFGADEGKIQDFLHKAHEEFVTATQKIQQYLG